MNQETLIKARRAFPWLVFVLLASLFLFSRLIWLDKLPVFIDEALQIQAARLVRSGSLGAGAADGKWLSLLIMSLFTFLPGDPLIHIRLASVFSGLLTAVAIFYCGRILFNRGVAWLAVLLYVLCPFALFYNRLALSDNIATMFGAWILYVSIAAIQTNKQGISFFLTMLIMAAILAKVSSFLFVLIPILTILILLPRDGWLSGLRKIIPVLLAAFILMLAVYWVDAGVSQAGSKTFTGDLLNRWLLIWQNLALLAGWSWGLMTPAGALFLLFAIIWAVFAAPGRSAWYLLSMLAISVLPYILVAGDWYPRYLTFALVPALLLIASCGSWLIDTIKGNVLFRRPAAALAGLFLIFLVATSLVLDINMIFQPEKAALPIFVRRLYISDWTAGYGVREMSAVLAREAQLSEDGLLVLRPAFLSQLYRGGLELYVDDARIDLGDIDWNFDRKVPIILTGSNNEKRVLIAVDTTHQESAALLNALNNTFPMTEIWHLDKPGAMGGMGLWEIQDNTLSVLGLPDSGHCLY